MLPETVSKLDEGAKGQNAHSGGIIARPTTNKTGLCNRGWWRSYAHHGDHSEACLVGLRSQIGGELNNRNPSRCRNSTFSKRLPRPRGLTLQTGGRMAESNPWAFASRCFQNSRHIPGDISFHNWCGTRESNPQNLASKASTYPSSVNPAYLVCAGGFDPPTTRFQGEDSTGLSYTQIKLC